MNDEENNPEPNSLDVLVILVTLSIAIVSCGGDLNDCANNCPVQVQCEFCWTVEDSKFFIRENTSYCRGAK